MGISSTVGIGARSACGFVTFARGLVCTFRIILALSRLVFCRRVVVTSLVVRLCSTVRVSASIGICTTVGIGASVLFACAGIVGLEAIAFVTDLTFGTLDVETGATDTITVFADSTFATLHVLAGVRDALAFDADFASVAGNVFTVTGFAGVFDAFALFAKLFVLALDTCTGVDTLAVFAELTRRTGHAIAGIADTLTFFADVVFVGTTFDIAVIIDTNAFGTDLAGATLNQATGIDTLTSRAKLSFWTTLVFAEVALTNAFFANRTFGTFAIATERTTGSLLTDLTFGTLDIVVHSTVAIVVFAVTHLLLRSGGGAS